MTDWRAEWFAMEDATYLNVAGQGVLPRVSIRAALQGLEWKKYPHKIPLGVHFDLPNRVRTLLARLIGAQSEEIAVTAGASAGLAVVANGLDWKPDGEVLIGQGEFPAQAATFFPLAAAGKVRIRIVKPRGKFITADDLVDAIGPKTRLVSASLVRFDDGARLDSGKVARVCHDAGALLMLDAAQCAGAMPLDVATLGADFIAISGYKWLLGPYGTGFFWSRPELIERLYSGPVYWTALDGVTNLNSFSTGTFRIARGAPRWDSPETASFFNLLPLEASLEFLLRAGVETVWQHNRKLIAQMIERLPLDRCVLASPADADERGPFVCIAARKPENTAMLFDRLREAGIIVTMREGSLRISPHLYNSDRDIDRLLTVLTV